MTQLRYFSHKSAIEYSITSNNAGTYYIEAHHNFNEFTIFFGTLSQVQTVLAKYKKTDLWARIK